MAIIDTPGGGAINTDVIAYVTPVLESFPGYYFAVQLTIGNQPLKFHHDSSDILGEQHGAFIIDWIKAVNGVKDNG